MRALRDFDINKEDYGCGKDRVKVDRVLADIIAGKVHTIQQALQQAKLEDRRHKFTLLPFPYSINTPNLPPYGHGSIKLKLISHSELKCSVLNLIDLWLRCYSDIQWSVSFWHAHTISQSLLKWNRIMYGAACLLYSAATSDSVSVVINQFNSERYILNQNEI